MDNHRSEKVAIIAGIGSRAEKIAPLALLGAMLNQKGYDTLLIDGAIEDGSHGSHRVLTPLEQTAQALNHIGKRGLVISQSMGALAALQCAEKSPAIAALALSPPLRNPSEILAHPRLKARSFVVPGGYTLASSSFGNDTMPQASIFVGDDYTALINEESVSFAERYTQIARSGRMQTVMSSEDWNTGLATTIADDPASFGTVHTIEGAPHSLYSLEPQKLHNWMAQVARWATKVSS